MLAITDFDHDRPPHTLRALLIHRAQTPGAGGGRGGGACSYQDVTYHHVIQAKQQISVQVS